MSTQVSDFVASDRTFQAKIVAESLTLPERFELFNKAPSRFELNESLSNTRMDHWRHTLGLDKDAYPTLRAKSLGINPKDLPLILGNILPDENAPTPSWWKICQGVLDGDSDLTTSTFLQKAVKTQSKGSDEESEKEKEKLIPFEDAIAPWVVVATRFLIQRCPDINTILSEDILKKEQRGLLENLSIITRSVLLHDFELRKTSSYDTNDLFLGLIVTNPPEDVYSAFITKILEDRWHSYIEKYPALARLMATRVELWVASLAEFAERVVADHDLIKEKFSPESPLGKLIKGGRGVSDSHNGARAVVLCEFENGCKVVYKPRSMSVDVAWTNFVEWFNSQFPDSNPMFAMDVIDCGTYGWMAFASNKPCTDHDEVRTYFKRMGMLLCAVHTLQGNDFHLENVIADGSMPIAIDLETISVPEPLSGVEEDDFNDQKAAQIFNRSVLRTLLLPMAMSQGRGAGNVRNLGAIGIEIDGDITGAQKYRKILSEINTDFMHWKLVTDEKIILELEDPMLNRSEVKLADGTPVRPQDYLDELIHGYQDAYRVIMKSKDRLLSPTGPLNALASSWVRILNRATNIYYRLIIETCNQNHLQSGVDRWIAADRFCVGFEDAEDNVAQDSFNQVVAMEHEALLRGDVAYFITQGNSLSYATIDIHTGEAISTEHTTLKASAIDAAKSQIDAMSEDDLKLQTQFIDSSYLTALLSLSKRMHAIAGIKEAETETTEDAEQKPISDDEIKSYVKSGLENLTRTMVEDEKSIQWIDLSSDPLTETTKVIPMDSGIYSGRGGIAILFERAARVFNNPQFLEIARKCLNYEARSIKRNSNPIFTPSGFLHTPGLMLGFWRIGANEGHGDLRDLTQKMISEFGQRAIDRDNSYDLIAGSAGMILVLARIHDEEPLPGITDLVTKLGEHLLANSCDDHGGPAWKSIPGEQALCGHSHGISGIALSLLHAYRLTGRTDFKETALAAIECEHRMRSDEFGNWPDLRSVKIGDELKKNNYLMHAWCHGLPGIMLNRAACLQIEDTPSIRDDYEFCLANKIEENYKRNHLCCGSSGLSEISRTVGRLMNNEDVTAHARQVLEKCIWTTQNNEDTGLIGEGLLQGMSGPLWAGMATIDDSDPNSHLLLAMP